MSTIKEVREMMGMEDYFENFEEYNVSIDDNEIDFEVIRNKIENEDLDEYDYEEKIEELDEFEYDEGIAQVIAKDGYDITGFKIHEIPIPEIITFINYEDDRSFDIMKSDEDGLWRPAYIDLDENGEQCEPFTNSIKEAIEKYNWTALTGEIDI